MPKQVGAVPSNRHPRRAMMRTRDEVREDAIKSANDHQLSTLYIG
jgi:hypothetical protein